MEMKELKDKSSKELNALLDEQREQLRTLRFRDASGQLKQVRDIRQVRRDIARILTEVKNRQQETAN
jgi:large subunit ribosomal protein L29